MICEDYRFVCADFHCMLIIEMNCSRPIFPQKSFINQPLFVMIEYYLYLQANLPFSVSFHDLCSTLNIAILFWSNFQKILGKIWTVYLLKFYKSASLCTIDLFK